MRKALGTASPLDAVLGGVVVPFAGILFSPLPVPETSSSGFVLGTATSTEASPTWSLDNDAGGFFAISGAGVVTLTATGAAGLDFETTTSYNITLNDGINTIDRTITITDVDEDPIFTGSPGNQVFQAGVQSALIDLANYGRDPEYDANPFTVAAPSFTVSPDLPAGVTLSVDGVLNPNPTVTLAETLFTFTITDAGGNTDTLQFNITCNAAANSAPVGQASGTLDFLVDPGPAATAASYINSLAGTSVNSTYTLNFGALAPGKYVVAVCSAGGAGVATACLIDGVTATQRGTGHTSGNNAVALFEATITDGTSVDIDATLGGGFGQCIMHLFNVDGLTFQSANGDGENNGAVNCNLTTLAGDSIIGAGVTNSNSTVSAWSGGMSDVQPDGTSFLTDGSNYDSEAGLQTSAAGGSPETITYGYSAFTGGAAIAAVYR